MQESWLIIRLTPQMELANYKWTETSHTTVNDEKYLCFLRGSGSDLSMPKVQVMKVVIC